MKEPMRIWWARPRKLCALERPGGGGRSHRPERREAEIAWLKEHGVRTVISTMATRHNLPAYEAAGLEYAPRRRCRPRPAARTRSRSCSPLLRRELRRAGAVAVHGNRHTDFVAAVCAAHLHEHRGTARGGLAGPRGGADGHPEACALLGVDYEAVQPRSRIAASTCRAVGHHVGVDDRAVGVDRDRQAGLVWRTLEICATGRPEPIRGFTRPVATLCTPSRSARPSSRRR